jgi:hypothetical protein
MMSGGTAGWPGWHTFGAGQFGPPQVFGLQRRISKTLATPVAVDSQAYGRLYAGPVPLQWFEENAGAGAFLFARFGPLGNAAQPRTTACLVTRHGRPRMTPKRPGDPVTARFKIRHPRSAPRELAIRADC